MKKNTGLNLNKQTIAFLNYSELNFVKGGSQTNQGGGDQTQLGSEQDTQPIKITVPFPSPSNDCPTTKLTLRTLI